MTPAPSQGRRRSVPLLLFVIIALSLLAAVGGASAAAVAANNRAGELVAALADEKAAAEAAADEAEQVLHQAEAATSSAEARAIQAEQRERVAEQAASDAAAAAKAQLVPSADEREFLELLRSNNPIFGSVDDRALVDLANNACAYLGTMGGAEGDFVDLMDMGIAAGFTEYQTASVLSAATVAMCPEYQLLGG
ncbi:DUF732 domain-containing protein [Modestobacter sp. VKM Ac-2984]|uniref:DUF732 domain-containing protein n=1 Tax=Modestobacter sp. VKM Ac-2984 TaxID=3004138 RepID=UPI0022AAD3A4|nr:DUF732 domain-containing protein [Modestobacter sp. VKM Ac-2984]MCZ2818658.1 DUF732 domain-containing protein [Modestobacter sp. VKM Ac-2984]